MAEKIVSPGVYTNEIDKSFLPAAIANIGAVLIGPTVKGLAGIPTVVSSYSDFQRKFGDSFKSGSNYYQYLTSHTAEQYLKHGNKLTVVRILAGSYSGASATITSSIDPAIVGGGAAHSASLTITAGDFGGRGEAFAHSASLTPYGGTKVDLIFTGSRDLNAAGLVTNTSTAIYFPSASTVATTALSASNMFNTSQSLHLLNLSASATATGVVFTQKGKGAYGVTGNPANDNTPTLVVGGSPISNYINITASSGAQINTVNFSGGSDFNSTNTTYVFKTPFKLHTLSDGAILNNSASLGTNSILTDGSKDNVRYEVSSVNLKKGTFTLQIRSGEDIQKKKQILESYTNINLDPNSTNYIGKAIGDQVQTVRTDENGKPFLQLSGSYANKSKYVRVEVLDPTTDYLDENGNVRVPAYSASLPAFYSGSNSGSQGGAFSGGSDGTVQHPKNFYNNISENNSQGLDPSGNGGNNGYNQYIQALDLLSNQDEYDINLILAPGIINSIHTSVASKIIDVCESRADCFAVIDPVVYGKNVVDATTQAKTRNSNYAAMYWPWVKVADSQVAGTNRWVPPSVTVAGVYTYTDKVSHEWFAPAGLNRGTINIAKEAERKLTQADRDTLYDSSVNPIATFPGQGVTVFGQKTLQKKASALDRVNVRRLLIKVKKFIASSSRFLVFEQNTAALRRRFLNIANPYLEQVQAQSGLSAFRVVMDESNNTPDTIDRNQLIGQLFLQPTRTAEFIVLDFTIQPTGAQFPE